MIEIKNDKLIIDLKDLNEDTINNLYQGKCDNYECIYCPYESDNCYERYKRIGLINDLVKILEDINLL